MLREDYVEDKLIFELKKHTGICLAYIVRSLYKKGTKDFPSPEGIVNVLYKESPMGLDGDLGNLEMNKTEQMGITDGRAGNNK